MKSRLTHILSIIASAIILLAACAKEGFPSGGPKDETPPVVIGALPANGTLNFNAKEFLINFDEYVQVRDADNNILVSPPMKQKPEYTTKGRGVLVKIKDTLRQNTTYLFQFKEGIVDFNEGNPLSSYEYVFSTGSTIDSMTLRGTVLHAFTAKPHDEAVTVVAWSEQQLIIDSAICDSVVAKDKPIYMTRCDKEGRFQLNHMRTGRYRLLAIDDADKNLMLNTDEAVAFLDTLITPYHMPAPPDTARRDTTATDSTIADTTRIDTPSTDSLATTLPQITLRLSLLKHETQRITKAEFTDRGQAIITTQCPLTPRYTLRPLDSTDTTSLYIYPNAHRDTLNLWTANADCDSLALVLADSNLCDTLRLQYRPKPGNKKMVQSWLRSLVQRTHPHFDTLRLAFDRPVAVIADSLPDSLVTVFNLTDSTTSHCPLQFYDSCSIGGHTRALILFHGHSGTKYRFTLPCYSLRDIYGNLNADSLVINTEYDKPENYGAIILTATFDSLAAPVILQLINDKGDALRQHILTASQQVTFAHLKAGKYSIRAILDLDTNGQWTPGDYYKHRQPEPVRYYDKTLDLRENWDMEETWNITY